MRNGPRIFYLDPVVTSPASRKSVPGCVEVAQAFLMATSVWQRHGILVSLGSRRSFPCSSARTRDARESTRATAEFRNRWHFLGYNWQLCSDWADAGVSNCSGKLEFLEEVFLAQWSSRIRDIQHWVGHRPYPGWSRVISWESQRRWSPVLVQVRGLFQIIPSS